ncbi:MAG: WxcM-like domain-containing protein [Tatlockia sp.]|nr:WxcM-like domain-containing protein [Tatlockia sp.]
MKQLPFIHQTADVQATSIGENTKIWQFVVILSEAKIGKDVNVCAHCFIENDVIIGDRVTIKSGVQLWDGVRLEDDVFIGPNVSFTNDKFPRSKNYLEKVLETRIEKGASIGAGAVILPGITIGTGAMIAAGAVVTCSVPANAVVKSPAARISHFVAKPFSLPAHEAMSQEPIHVGVGKVTLHSLNLIQDPRGDLSVGEFLKDIPFSPKRYFFVFNVPEGKVRGEHAHHHCHQFLICVKGSCTVLVDDGKSRTDVVLNKPNLGIYLPPLTWGTQYNYSSDALLLVFASDYYENEDYIRNYDLFCRLSLE